MNTYWQFSINVGERCVASCSAASLAKAIQTGMRDAIYYQAVYPNETISIRDLREYCSGCSNTGLVTKKKRFGTRRVKCPNCYGDYPTMAIDRIELELPESANRIKIVQEINK